MLEALIIITFLYLVLLILSLKVKAFLFSPLLFLLAFGSFSYYTQRYDLAVLFIVASLLLFFIWTHKYKVFKNSSYKGLLIPLIFFVTSAIVYMSILMRYPVPPGADSALHLFMVNSKNLLDPYPQAMHVLMNAFKILFDFGNRDTFIIFQYIMALEFLYWSALFFMKVSKSVVYLVIGLGILLINPSFYNNIINGAITHNLGIVFVLSLLTLLVYRDKLSVNQQMGWYFVLALGSLYSHSITFVILIAIVFLYRLFGPRVKKSQAWFKIEIGALVLSIPLYFALDGLGFYHWFILAVAAFILIKEIVLRLKFREVLYSFLLNTRFIKYVSILGLVLNVVVMFFVAPMSSWNGYTFAILTSVFYLLSLLSQIKLGRIGFTLFYFHIISNAVYMLVSILPFESLSFSLAKNLLYFYITTIPIIFITYKTAKYLSPKVGHHPFLFLVIIFLLIIQVGRVGLPNSIINAVDPYIYSKYSGYRGFGVFADASDIEVIKKIRTMETAPILNVGYLDSLWIFLGSSDVLYRKGGVSNLEYVELSSLQYSREIYLDNIVTKYPDILYVYIPSKTKVRVIAEQVKLELVFNSNGDALYKIQRSK